MKTITPQELLELAGQGAGIETEDKQTVIEGFAQLLSTIERIAKANELIAKKQSEQIKSTLQELTKVIDQKKPVNMESIKSLLTEISFNTTKEVVGYDFEIKRNSRGLLSGMSATPKRTIN